MYPTFIALLAGLVAAAPAPAPQGINFDLVDYAPSPSFTGPPVTAVTQSDVYNTASAAAAATTAVTTVVTTIASSSVAAKRGYWSGNSPSSSTSTPYTTSQPTTSQSTTSQPTSQPSTSTTSATTCSTSIEPGTYCGFINPNDPCAPQPDGYGPVPNPDTPAAFEEFQQWSMDALSAHTPAKYVEVFKNLNASVSANSYLGLYTLSSYDVEGCSQWCDNTTLCTAFNIYIERDPSLNPTAGQCPNPPSITNYKCTLWGSSISTTDATNTGQQRVDFEVVIAGSNGYDKTNNTTPPPCTGWQPPKPCSPGTIISNPSCNLGSSFFAGPYNPNVCASFATAQTAANKNAAWATGQNSYLPANSFNSFCVKKNGIALGTYCVLFEEVVDVDWAVELDGQNGEDLWEVESSWIYVLGEVDTGVF